MDEHGWHFYDERDRVLPLPSSSVGGRLSLPHLQYSPYVGPHNPRSAPLPLPHHPYSSQQQQSPPPPPPPLPALPTGDQQQQSPGVVHSRSVNPAVQSTLWLRQEDQQRGSTLPPLDISSSRYDHNNSSRPMYQQQHASYSTAHPYPSHSNRRSNSGDYTPSPTSSIFPERGWPTASRASSASQLSPVENTVTVGELVSTLPVNFEHAEQVASTSSALISAPLGPADKTKPFISILYSILSNPDQYRDCITWDEAGTSFIVSHNDRLVNNVLPRHFQHSNLQSFTRQLNVYEFTRMTTPQLLEKLDLSSPTNTTNYSGWSHPLFIREDRSLLPRMKPRPSKARLIKKAEKMALQEAERRKTLGLP